MASTPANFNYTIYPYIVSSTAISPTYSLINISSFDWIFFIRSARSIFIAI